MSLVTTCSRAHRSCSNRIPIVGPAGRFELKQQSPLPSNLAYRPSLPTTFPHAVAALDYTQSQSKNKPQITAKISRAAAVQGIYLSTYGDRMAQATCGGVLSGSCSSSQCWWSSAANSPVADRKCPQKKPVGAPCSNRSNIVP